MTSKGFIVRVSRGALHVCAEDYARYFDGISGIVLLRRDNDLLILPVRLAQAGGYILKRKNLAGDRVAHAPDFFRANGITDENEREIEVFWDPTQGGLVAADALIAY